MRGMECGCACDIDYEPAEFFTQLEVIARKEHTCCECGERIKPGERYERTTAMWCGDSAINTYKTCLICAAIRREYCCSYGGVRQELCECLGLDYVSGETFE